MISRVTTAIAAAFLLFTPVTGNAALSAYSQDFETLSQAAPGALGADGWLVYGNVFSPDHSTWYYGYGPYPAPNGGPAFSAIAAGQGGVPQGAQQLVVYSDYNNGDHGNGNLVEANVFQERTVGAADVGSNWTFQFDAKKGDLAPPTAALAFIKTLDPNAGYAMTNFITFDTASLPTTWGTYGLSISIAPALNGQILQFGFASTTTGYTPSGVLYDNLVFRNDAATPATNSSWGRLKSLYR